MFALRRALPMRRMFSTTPAARTDVAKLILIGRIGAEPQVKLTKNEKEYVSYAVATTSFSGPVEEGGRPEPQTTWHRVLSFNPAQNQYLKNVPKGAQVYVEANFEVREPVPGAEPGTNEAQKQIFLKHETMRILSKPRVAETEATAV